MCTRVSCGKCGKATYVGCGRHVEQVLRGVAPSARCDCRAQSAADPSSAGGDGGDGEARGRPWWWPF